MGKYAPDDCVEFAIFNQRGLVGIGVSVPEASFDALQQIIESFTGESESALRIKSAERKLYNKKKMEKRLFYQYSNYL